MNPSPHPYELHHVSVTLGDTVVLRDLNLTINWGEKVAILGASGAGKSTLLRLLNGAIDSMAGEFTFLGQPRHQLSPRQLRFLQRQIGTIYQQFHLIRDVRVIHNVNAGHLARWPLWKSLLSLLYPLEWQQAQAVLAQVGMADKLFSATSTLSGGQQQRVAIARVLIQNPMVVLADEPVSSLDPRLSDDIMSLLISLLGQQPRTFIGSLHDVTLAKRYCDRIIGLKSGRVCFDESSEAVTPNLLSRLYEV